MDQGQSIFLFKVKIFKQTLRDCINRYHVERVGSGVFVGLAMYRVKIKQGLHKIFACTVNYPINNVQIKQQYKPKLTGGSLDL